MKLDHLTKLKAISAVFLSDAESFSQLQAGCLEYKSQLLELSGLDLDDFSGKADIFLENGKALGTTWAAMCIDDFIRTQRFVKGLFEAVQSLKSAGRKPIHILYAGCGPFASLALPIMLHFSNADVQFTLLEINPLSFEKVKKVIAVLGLESYIKRLELVDATKYRIPQTDAIDILLSETMQRALSEEQQVPILLNLLSQIENEVLLIPENISLEWGILTPIHTDGFTNSIPTIKLGNIATLSTTGITQNDLIRHWKNGQTRFWENTFSLSKEQVGTRGQLAILTEIQVFGNERITYNQSGLSTPLILVDLSQFPPQDMKLNSWYEMGDRPKVNFTLSS